MLNSRAVTIATVVGTVLQLAMVFAGHSNPSIAKMFAAGGMSISLVAGIVYASQAREGSVGSTALGGLIAGGLCALIGIAVSFALGDVAAIILAIGTLSSVVTGAIGGWLGRFAFGGARRMA
jgi:general stress protein CsbA